MAQDAPKDKGATTTVTVEGKKPLVKRTIEGAVYDVGQTPQARTGTAADVLKTVPQVSVSPEGQVRLRGDSNVQVYINGKPSADMAPENRAITLQTMPGADIASVEVITNPSARYNANGGGIINIVLKKHRKPGAGGALNINSSDMGRFNATLGMRHDGALTRKGSDSFWRGPDGAPTGESVQAARAFARRYSSSASLSLDYTLSDRDDLTLNARRGDHHSHNALTETHRDYDAGGGLRDDYLRLSNGPNAQRNDSLGLVYDHRADTGAEVKLSLTHSLSKSLHDKSYRDLYLTPARADGFEHVFDGAATRLDEISGDYARPLGRTMQVTAGFDAQAETDPMTDISTQGGAARFTVRRRLSAAYATWQGDFGRLGVLAGARLESLRTVTDASASTYGNLNPSLHLSYDLGRKRTLKASLTRSLQRPDAADLNPNRLYVDAQNSTAGDPRLKPQRVAAAEAEYDYSGDALTWSVTAYARASDGTVSDYSYPDADTLLTTKRNSGRGRSRGLAADASGQHGQLSWRAGANLFHARLQTQDIDGVLRRDGVSWTAQSGLDYDLDRDSFSLDLSAAGRTLTSQGWRAGTNSLALSWQRRIAKRLAFVVNASDVLRGSRQSFATRNFSLSQTGYSDFRGALVFAGLRWTLGGH
jgi:outer membrane receptor protein involved in Fe transport